MSEVYKSDVDYIRLSQNETHASLANALVERSKARQISELIVAAGQENERGFSLALKYLGVARSIDEQKFLHLIRVYISEVDDDQPEAIMRIMAYAKRSEIKGIIDIDLINKVFKCDRLAAVLLKDNGLLVDSLIYSLEQAAPNTISVDLQESLKSLKDVARNRYDASFRLDDRIEKLVKKYGK